MSGARVEARSFAPPPRTRWLVEAYWAGSWDLRGQEPHTTLLLGDPCVHIVFEEGRSRVVGVWTRTWRRTLEGVGRVRAAKLRAGAAGALLPVPVRDLTDALHPLRDLLDCPPRVERDVLRAADHAEGVARIDAWLSALVPAEPPPDVALATRVMERIAADRAVVTVDGLAAATGVAPRALQRLFREHVGATPKQVIRRHRLQEAALRMERGDDDGLARLAGELGYADQAHLARDFKAAVGRTPRQFARDVHR